MLMHPSYESVSSLFCQLACHRKVMPERRVELRLGREKVVQNRKGGGQQRADVTVQQHIERVIPLKQGLHF